MTLTNPIPEGFHTVTPYLVISGAVRAIEFYKTAFGKAQLLSARRGRPMDHRTNSRVSGS